MIKIALLGFGVVGSGTAEVLTENKEIIKNKVGHDYEIKYILDLRDFPDSPFADKIVHDINIIVNDPEISVVGEMMGGSHPAYEFTRACLESGKNVVTANKELVSTFGAELCRIAAEHGVRYLFEASVGGGIPIIRPLINDLSSNKITRICGILNGTTNYILTSMRDSGANFNDALSNAQRLGYAEANPSADVDGIDAARKTAILAAIASGKLIDPKTIHTEGISKITLTDTKICAELGLSIKLIGYTEVKDGKILALVSPRAIFSANPLSHIDDVLNGVLVNANMVGEVMFYGPGAGKLPTASAVVADIIDIIENRDNALKTIEWTAATDNDISDLSEYSCRRVIVFSDNSLHAQLPEGVIRSCDGIYGLLTDNALTERDMDKLAEKLGDKIISSYRVL